jgi:hypothetical protein
MRKTDASENFGPQDRIQDKKFGKDLGSGWQ